MFTKLVKWLASAIEDKKGSISSKRLGFYYCLFVLGRAINNPSINEVAIYTFAGLAFGLAGLTIPEWFTNIKSNQGGKNNPNPDN